MSKEGSERTIRELKRAIHIKEDSLRRLRASLDVLAQGPIKKHFINEEFLRAFNNALARSDDFANAKTQQQVDDVFVDTYKKLIDEFVAEPELRAGLLEVFLLAYMAQE